MRIINFIKMVESKKWYNFHNFCPIGLKIGLKVKNDIIFHPNTKKFFLHPRGLRNREFLISSILKMALRNGALVTMGTNRLGWDLLALKVERYDKIIKQDSFWNNFSFSHNKALHFILMTEFQILADFGKFSSGLKIA